MPDQSGGRFVLIFLKVVHRELHFWSIIEMTGAWQAPFQISSRASGAQIAPLRTLSCDLTIVP